MYASIKSLIAPLAGLAALTASIPAQAAITTFATYTQISTASTLRWQKIGTSGGSLYTISSQSSTVPGAVGVQFNFLQPALAALGDLSASYTFSGTTPQGNPAVLSAGFLIQPVVSGSFSFTYTGLSPLVVGSTVYTTGANLLTGTFTDATIVGAAGATSGSLSDATTSGGTIVYTSDFLSFGLTQDKDFSISLTSITPALFRANASSSLRTFRGSSTGSFSTDPAPIVTGVPEPAVWGLMIVGFGMIGIQSRRRKIALPVAY